MKKYVLFVTLLIWGAFFSFGAQQSIPMQIVNGHISPWASLLLLAQTSTCRQRHNRPNSYGLNLSIKKYKMESAKCNTLGISPFNL